MLKNAIENKLREYHDPYLGKDLYAANALKSVSVAQNQIEIDLVLGYPFASVQKRLQAELENLFAPLVQDKPFHLKLSSQIDAHVGKQGVPGLPNVKNIIAIGSGKGGVGKSTIAINLALALVQEGARVGMLDADIYGPSQPAMLGALGEKPAYQDGLLPIERHGIQSMSIGYLIDQSAPMVWRGPMIGKALQQLLQDTKWQQLDYLIVDLPPGTGDIQLTLCQKIPVSGAIIVTTPQDLALLDVARACEMFNKLNVPLLGVIENMNMYHCPACGHAEPIFGAGGGQKLAQQYDLAYLGDVPLDVRIREMTDNGNPIVQDRESHYADLFGEIARKTTAKLALQAKDYSAKFPKIVVKGSDKEDGQ